MAYVDGFLLPVPKKKLQAYRREARRAAKIFKELGALEFRECVGDDLFVQGMLSFTKTIKVKPGETVMFSWIVYRSRAHRDRVNAKMMKDPRMNMDMAALPFDAKRMAYGGFKVIVEA